MDKETTQLASEQKLLQDLIGHEGWPIVRKNLVNRVLELQDAFSIEDGDPQKMFMDLGARRIASTTLYDFLRDIEGTAQQVIIDPVSKNNYVVFDK